MTSLERVARPAAWAEPPSWLRFIQDTLTITEAELRKIRHDPVELITRAVQPILWLLVFGQVLAQTRAIPTGNAPLPRLPGARASSPRAPCSARSSSGSR